MRIIACDPYPDADWAGQNEIEYLPLEDLLPQSHLVSLHTPLTPDTHHLIDDEALNLMMTGAYLVNTSRGKLINTRALIGALKRKKLWRRCSRRLRNRGRYLLRRLVSRGHQ